MLESTYQQCLASELTDAKIAFQLEAQLPVQYKSKRIDCGYRVDILVENKLIVELKAVDTLLPIHEAQLLTYMKLANIDTGFLINFNVRLLRDGINRFVL